LIPALACGVLFRMVGAKVSRVSRLEHPPTSAAESARSAMHLSTNSASDAFDWQPRTRIIFGAGTLARVGEVAAGLGGRRVLVVTDSGIAAAGHVERARTALRAAGLSVAVDDEVRENPTTADVARCLEIARDAEVDLIIGLGGGSSLDTAKGCNFLLTNGGEMKDYWGVGKATKPMLPLIAIPTTSGTGSETQSAALIADEVTHQKMACLDPKAAARVAILDPELTLSQPPRVTACTGIDAIAHAVESAVSKKRTLLSAIFSREAFRLCHLAFPRVLTRPNDLEARGQMQLGAAYAGLAIENAMLGAAHSAANPLTAHHAVVHGQAVGIMLPAVVRFNCTEPDAERGYDDLCIAAELRDAEHLAVRLEELLELAGLKLPLRDFGVGRALVPALAEEAAKQWTANFNPREALAADFAALYESLL
jgi:alcohol dehydrogenase